MPQKGFADSFFSPDYAAGLGVLFQKLNQGCVENEELLSLAQARAEAEHAYGLRLQELARGGVRRDGFHRDDGASARKAFDGMRKEMEESGKNHIKVAQNLDAMVIRPFGRWSADHLTRVNNSHDELQQQVKVYDRQVAECKKLRQAYYNKCRMLEDLEEETNLAFPVPATATTPSAEDKGKGKEGEKEEEAPKSPPSRRSTTDDDDWPLEIGDSFYSKEQLSELLATMMKDIPQKEVKVTILGVYKNCSTGADIVNWLVSTLGPMNVSYAERIGQDLVDNGYIRLIGSVGRSFANSSVFNYQWTKKSFATISGDAGVKRTDSLIGQAKEVPYVGEMIGQWIGSGAVEGETPKDRLKREVKESENTYKECVFRADRSRCRLEELMVDHLNYMEKCELDRLKAVKSVLLDISAALSNIIPGIQASVDNMLLYQETIQPEKDLRFMIESYRTGDFVPKVLVYENYYNSAEGRSPPYETNIDQTYGVDIELRARADHKRVPGIVSVILMHLDERYLELENDDKRKAVWLTSAPLAKIHELRAKINNGKIPDPEVLKAYDVSLIASALKLYFLELPDPLVSYTVYDIVKSIYASNNNLEDIRSRISAIQNTLSQLRVTNIATLDAVTQHFSRLFELAKADDEWISELAHSLGYCIIRPRVESSVTHHDRHAHRLITDLITHRDKIFKELKRQSNRKNRPDSLDESHRRERSEARARAVSAAARSPRLSPADQANGAEKSPAKRVSGISGILSNRTSLALDPAEPLSLDGGLPPGGADEPLPPTDKSGSVEVTVTDTVIPSPGDGSPRKKPSLNRSSRIGVSRPVGLQRHFKRESVQQGDVGLPSSEIQDKDAAAVAANTRRSMDAGKLIGVTLTDGPRQE